MPMLNCYVDDRTYETLKEEAEASGRKIEELAEAAIEEAAIRSLTAHGPSSADPNIVHPGSDHPGPFPQEEP